MVKAGAGIDKSHLTALPNEKTVNAAHEPAATLQDGCKVLILMASVFATQPSRV
jgi:hypothetical protein